MRNAVAFEVKWDDERKCDAGAYQFIFREGEQVPIGIIHACPCGCKGRSAMYFKDRMPGHQEWTVEGDWPKVTCVPSIGIKPLTNGRYHWHGFLRNGVFEEL